MARIFKGAKQRGYRGLSRELLKRRGSLEELHGALGAFQRVSGAYRRIQGGFRGFSELFQEIQEVPEA